MMYGFGGHGLGMGFGWLLGFFVLVFIIWFIVRIMNQNNITGTFNRNSALNILKERYARGEIDKVEFDIRKKDLLTH